MTCIFYSLNLEGTTAQGFGATVSTDFLAQFFKFFNVENEQYKTGVRHFRFLPRCRSAGLDYIIGAIVTGLKSNSRQGALQCFV